MLDKKICRRCINASRRDGDGEIVPWNDMDESEWEDGRASCEDLYMGNPVIEVSGASAAIDEPPPMSCRMRLEQLMAQEDKR